MIEFSQLLYVNLDMTRTTHLSDQNNRSRCIFRHDQYFLLLTTCIILYVLSNVNNGGCNSIRQKENDISNKAELNLVYLIHRYQWPY